MATQSEGLTSIRSGLSAQAKKLAAKPEGLNKIVSSKKVMSQSITSSRGDTAVRFAELDERLEMITQKQVRDVTILRVWVKERFTRNERVMMRAWSSIKSRRTKANKHVRWKGATTEEEL